MVLVLCAAEGLVEKEDWELARSGRFRKLRDEKAMVEELIGLNICK